MELKERIEAILSFVELSAAAFAKKIGVRTPQTIYDLTSGKTRTLSPDVLSKITSCYPSLSIEWLLTGNGAMIKETNKKVTTTIKERIKEFIQNKNLKMKDFEESCHLSSGYVASMRKSFGTDKLNNVLKTYPELNREWLLYGEGEMIKASHKEDTKTREVNFVPLIPPMIQAGSLSCFFEAIHSGECQTIASPLQQADLAITVTGDSMSPEYVPGAIVLMKRVNERAFLEWGKVYVLDTCNGVVIKKIHPGKNEGEIECVSINPTYSTFTISRNDIYSYYRVIMCMTPK